MPSNFPHAIVVFNAWARIAVEAQCVIAMRMMGGAGLWKVPSGENHRMVAEKWKAAFDSGLAAWRAAALGGAPMAVALAFAEPVGRATRANTRRLAPGHPLLAAPRRGAARRKG